MNLISRSVLALLIVGGSLQAANPKVEKSYPVTGTLHPILVTTISSQVSGRVQEVLVDIGDKVGKDQVLVKIDPVFFEMDYKKQKASLELAKVGYEQARKEFVRMRNLWNKRKGENSSITHKQFDDAKAIKEQKKLLLDQALIDLQNTKIRLSETEIKAPYAGVITKRFVDPGEAVTVVPVVPVLEIMDLSELVLEFSLPQDMLSVVQPGYSIRAQVDGMDKSIEGKIKKILPAVDASSRSFKCQVVIDNEHLQLQPGLSLSAKIQLK
jgi:membrane fusion protein (multidrug efflux system)